MILQVCWKEYREQRHVWLAMAALAALLLVGLAQVLTPQGSALAPDDVQMVLVVAALVLAVTYGLVCGGLMLAGEREAGTLAFLDALPALRLRVWAAKVLAGLVLALSQGLAVAGLTAWLGLDPRPSGGPQHWFWFLPALTVLAFAWGMVGSALCRSVLAAVVVAAPLLLLSALFGGATAWPYGFVGALVTAAHVALALGVSAVVFARVDLTRRAPPARRRAAEPAGPGPSGWYALFWLAARQGRVELALLAVGGALVGLLLPALGLAAWAPATLVIGVVCGTAAFRHEQADRAYRFLGSQRLPPAQVWAAKVGFWLAAALGVAALMGVTAGLSLSVVVSQQAPSSAGPTSPGEFRWWYFLNPVVFAGLWLLYGFSVGHLCALIFRKGVVAVTVALLVAALLTVPWLPSLLAGGLHAWQVYPVPAILLVTGLLLMRVWVGDRLFAPCPLGLQLAVAALVVAWTVGGLWYRVAEVPDVGPPFDVAGYRASLPAPEENQAGSLIRQALQLLRIQRQHDNDFQQRPALPAPGGMMPEVKPRPKPLPEAEVDEKLNQVRTQGWRNDKEFDPWLERRFRGAAWVNQLREASQLPLGVVEDPRHLTFGAKTEVVEEGQRAAKLFTARALQLQARGDHEAGLTHLAVVLALARNLCHRAVPFSYVQGLAVEETALDGFDHWLAGLDHRPDLVRQALAELARHEAARPPISDTVKAEYLVLQNSRDDPERLLAYFTGGDGRPWGRGLGLELLTASWQTPWEKARADRLVDAVFAGWVRGYEAEYPVLASQAERGRVLPSLENWLPPDAGPERALSPERLSTLVQESWLFYALRMLGTPRHVDTHQLCRLRATRLTTALALYQADEGKPAAALEALVPRYLGELPTDPFSGRPFGYRVSAGERVQWGNAGAEPEGAVREVPAGQGVIWSTGPDGVDQGGVKQDLRRSRTGARSEELGLDLIYLVPQLR